MLSVGVAATLKQQALEIGFDLVGIAPLAVWKDLEFSRQWVEQGYGGEMRYLENPKREDPRRILPSVKSVVCVGLIYNAPLSYSTQVGNPPFPQSNPISESAPFERQAASQIEDGRRTGAVQMGPSAADNETTSAASRRGLGGPGGPRGWLSRYAWGQDYHEIMRAKLEQLRAAIETLAPGTETRVYVDTGPIVERAFARYSGIGWMGKNTCLINEAKGSWFFIGVILAGLELTPDLPAPDRCGSCTRCLEACPTGALVQPYVMDASRCIAYLTIELKSSIPAEFRSAIGANVFGCDICQDVCPWNSPRRAGVTDAAEFQPLRVELQNPGGKGEALTESLRNATDDFSLFNPPLEALASLTEEDFRRVFSQSAVKRVKYRGWLRNLCVAMGNSGNPRFVPWLERAREHPDPIVREHAAWALERLAATVSNHQDTKTPR